MFGDFVLFIKQSWKEFWCIHDYEFDRLLWSLPTHLSMRCRKCGRLK